MEERISTRDKIIDLRKKDPSIPAAEMARQLEVSRQAIGDHLKRLGLPTSFYVPPTCEGCGIKVRYGANQCTDCRKEELRVTVSCGTCGVNKEILKSEIRYRQRAKRYVGKTWYCDKTCFYNRKNG